MFAPAPRFNSGHAQKVLTNFSWPLGTIRKSLSLISLLVSLQGFTIASASANSSNLIVPPLPGGICRSQHANPTACVQVETFVAAIALGSTHAAQAMLDQASPGLSTALLNAATVGLGVITNIPASVELLLHRSGPRTLRKTWIHSEVIQNLPNYWEIGIMARRNAPELGFPLLDADFQMSALQLSLAIENRSFFSERLLMFSGGNWEMAQLDSAKNTILHYLIFFDRPQILRRWSNLPVFPRYIDQLAQMLDSQNAQGLKPRELIDRIYISGSDPHVFWMDIIAQLARIRSSNPQAPADTVEQSLRNGRVLPSPRRPSTHSRNGAASLVVSSRL